MWRLRLLHSDAGITIIVWTVREGSTVRCVRQRNGLMSFGCALGLGLHWSLLSYRFCFGLSFCECAGRGQLMLLDFLSLYNHHHFGCISPFFADLKLAWLRMELGYLGRRNMKDMPRFRVMESRFLAFGIRQFAGPSLLFAGEIPLSINLGTY
ncbi:hypothetical protein EDD37DRAFT_69816 [Exophiala viscosa]|uniref:uncharacterized protein n=1 Tax=Exophiala viscosa TaxID=2486360 RepID=UPI002194D4D4|nr:hypothetical protein EDD37DRAFT_69816 [Exophiala viscosa]